MAFHLTAKEQSTQGQTGADQKKESKAIMVDNKHTKGKLTSSGDRLIIVS
jgi:hypothetical protein